MLPGLPAAIVVPVVRADFKIQGQFEHVRRRRERRALDVGATTARGASGACDADHRNSEVSDHGSFASLRGRTGWRPRYEVVRYAHCAVAALTRR